MLLLKFWKWPSCHSKKDESRNVREYETQLGRLTSYNWSDYNLHTWEKRRAFLGWESVRERACSSGEGLVHCWSRWSLVSPSLSLKGQCWEQPGLQGHFYELPTPDGDQRISGEWPSCLHVLSLWPGGRGLRENTACNPVFPIIYKKKQSHQEIRQRAFCLYQDALRDAPLDLFPRLGFFPLKKGDGFSDSLASKGEK